MPHEIKSLIFASKTVICPITKNTYVYKENKYPSYFVDIILNGPNNKIAKYMDKINGQSFYFVDNEFIIIPDLLKYPINQNDIDLWNFIKEHKDPHTIYDFIIKLHFNLFIRDPNIKSRLYMQDYKYKNVYTLEKNDALILFKKIKIIVKTFYKNLFDYIDESLIMMYIYPDPKYNCFFIKFSLFDIHKGYKYLSFIDYFKTIPLDFAIKALESNQDLTYFNNFDINSKESENNCQNNFLYNLYRAHKKSKEYQSNFSTQTSIIKTYNKEPLINLLKKKMKKLK